MTDDRPPVRVLIVDDDPLVRGALSMMLSMVPGLVVAGEVADGSHVEKAVAEHAPDVVLMDIRMPRLDGLAATERLRARPAAPEVVILTTFDTDEHILRALRAGAGGFLLKDSPPARIVEAIVRVAAGEPILSPNVIRRLMTRLDPDPAETRRGRAERLLAALTERERDVATAVGRGASNAEIARELHMSVATVKAHVSRMLTKLRLNNRVQLALLAHDAADGS
ncbi:response regulator [Phytomonospora endophytica]|uniref:DNA-binding NarL/FixJ family response regulator n=1 Tax=Phytomonospora endophytica TaxID=714109 RepID=A0A841FJ83_9ACTN|nr:response regulator transcription factor [Phytomonospora endophytica]MBB6036256.1 DNA-binding NarL/FixJ family response regulator [Phytomonospora endophytica]GIG67163.1 DNA-binding response regulator [Phytomonospora endophytica]